MTSADVDDPARPARVAMPAAQRAVADAAKGFLPPAEAEALYDAAYAVAAAGPILEVGTYCGKSAVWLGAAARERGGHVFTVDHHRGSEEHQSGRMDTFPFFRRTVAAAGLEDVVTAIVGRSATVASLWSTPLALLFIDGGHAVEHCVADYQGWARHVQPGSLLAVHDVFVDPADGGPAPYEHIYRPAIAAGFEQIREVGSLRVLRRPGR